MAKQTASRDDFFGLTEEQVAISRQKHGSNVVDNKKDRFSELGKKIIRDPMLLLLVAAGVIYFLTGNAGDGWFMLAAIIAIVSISLYQDRRSQKALDALRVLTQPNCRVFRNGDITSIRMSDVVIGDYLLAEEGSTIAADGTIERSNDFAVNESILTGESLPVEKTASDGNNEIYQGTVVTRGLAVCRVTAIGVNTKLGKIGQALATIDVEETPLQKQIEVFVKRMAIVGSLFFAGVWSINIYHGHNILESLLRALSLAMSILPEEIPVAFVTFMAVGAWRLSKLGIIVKHISTIETLGSATVICVDKTGTVTKNQMDLKDMYVYKTDSIEERIAADPSGVELIDYAMWASEPIPFDPMEVALHEAYSKLNSEDKRKDYRIIHEYPLSGQPPFMTHIFRSGDGSMIIAAKGAPEGILKVCNLSLYETDKVMKVIRQLSSSGARVLGVAKGYWDATAFPASQTDISFTFLGLVSFYDPPKDNMRQVLSSFNNAGIKVKMITGDYTETALSIADQIGLKKTRVLTGNEVMQMEEPVLQREVEAVNIFARTFPEAKLKILNAIKKNGHVVAMTGDGVNDGPALKAAHIGVAMGKRGTEVARQVSAMILSDDDLGKMVDAVAAGRKIYSNLKKAIQYIISIHIPIILVVFLPLLFNWSYPFMFTPVHVIFLELIMGPTCSIIYENEPIEPGLMHQKPRPFERSFFNWRELAVSIAQGLGIAVGTLAVYQYAVSSGSSEVVTRTMVFITLISSNIFLTLVNRSSIKQFWISIRYRNPLIPFIIFVTILLTSAILFLDPVSKFFQVTSPTVYQVVLSCGVGFISVIWIDLVKILRSKLSPAAVLMSIGLLSFVIPTSAQDARLRTEAEKSNNIELRKFYASNNYSPAWTNTRNRRELITSIGTISLDGLDPGNYNFQYLANKCNEADTIAFDIALTESFLDLAHDLYQGRIDPDKLFPGDWEACTTRADYGGLLLAAINGQGICETLDFLKPMDNGYEGLKYMLNKFSLIGSKDNFPPVPFGNAIHPGDIDERIADIRKRLSALGMLMTEFNNDDVLYDSIVVDAVKKFQRLHGLTPDGEIGRRTQQAMQLTVDDYISTIIVNLEKFRWHQSRLLDRSVKINIPSYELILSDNDKTELRMKVIIGRTERPTPVINSAITAIVINPTWTVPPTILKEDVLPAVRSDINYLRNHKMKVLNSRGEEINPDSIEWSKITERNFPYHIQQDAGPTNPLGRIKFFIPNHHSVYLHDTNMPSLFASQERAVSSGCIRIELPMALVRLLSPSTGWTEEMVRDQIESGETRIVLVKNPLPIHLTYFTAYVDNNELYVVKDLYDYDRVTLHALQGAKRALVR